MITYGTKEEFSPIEQELQRIAIQVGNACGSSYQICDKCGRKDRGFSNLMEGSFTCVRCYIKKEAERLEADPEWMKKEKIWKMRQARKVWDSKLTLFHTTPSEKEEFDRRIYDKMLQSV